MINIEDHSDLIPARAGRIVGVASYRGEFLVVACEYGLYRLWEDGVGITRVSPAPESERGNLPPRKNDD